MPRLLSSRLLSSLLSSLLLCSACATLHPTQKAPTPLSLAWAEAERALAARGNPGGVAAAQAALAAVLKIAPHDQRAMGWQARLEWSLFTAANAGLPQDALSAKAHLLNALEAAYTCLQSEPSFNASLSAHHGQMTADTLLNVDHEAGDCLIWAMAATLDMTLERGPGAQLSAQEVSPILIRLSVLEPTDPEGWQAWLHAKLAKIEGQQDIAEKSIHQAITKSPGNLLFYATAMTITPTGTPMGPPPEPATPDPLMWENQIARAQMAMPM